MKKTILYIIVGSFLSLSLSGCGAKPSPAPKQTVETIDPSAIAEMKRLNKNDCKTSDLRNSAESALAGEFSSMDSLASDMQLGSGGPESRFDQVVQAHNKE